MTEQEAHDEWDGEWNLFVVLFLALFASTINLYLGVIKWVVKK